MEKIANAGKSLTITAYRAASALFALCTILYIMLASFEQPNPALLLIFAGLSLLSWRLGKLTEKLAKRRAD